MRPGLSDRFQHRNVSNVILKNWSWFFLAMLVIVFSIFGNGFLDIFNFQSIALNASVLALMALGQTFVILIGNIDLSTGYVAGLASVVVALAVNASGVDSLPVLALVGLLTGIGVGVGTGAANGIVVERMRVPGFIVTLGMYGIAQGLALLISNGQPVALDETDVNKVGNGYLLYWYDGSLSWFSAPDGLAQAQMREVTGILPNMVLLVVILFLACAYLLSQTSFGRHVYAVGGNRDAARRAGVNVARVTFTCFVLCGVLACVAGFVYAMRFMSGSSIAAEASVLQSVAAVVIGGASLFGGSGRVSGTVAGVAIVAVIQNGLVILGVNPYWQFIAVGLVIILAVVIDTEKRG
jgi:ribose transport system permease protein